MSIFSVLANEGCWGLNELILPHLSDQDIGAMRLTCQRFKNFIDSQKFWYERILVAILKKTDDITMTEIIQNVLDTKDVKKMQELTGLYLRMDYKIHSPLWQLAAQEGFLEVFEFCWNWSDGRVFRVDWENKSALHKNYKKFPYGRPCCPRGPQGPLYGKMGPGFAAVKGEWLYLY